MSPWPNKVLHGAETFEPRAGHALRRGHGRRATLWLSLLLGAGAATWTGAEEPPALVVLPPDSTGWFRLATGIADHQVLTLEASADLRSWTPIAVVHEGLRPFGDPGSASRPQRFYRARQRARTANDDFKNQVVLPEDRFMSSPLFGSDEPRWIKFAILTAEPTRVVFQDSQKYRFHYDFAVARLEPFAGLSREAFDALSLHPANQQVVLGAVLFPPLPPDAQPPLEFGVQFVGQEPYPPERVVELFTLVQSTVAGPPTARAFYMPTFEQSATAEQHRDFLAARGVPLSAADRWAGGDSCYAAGWALGRLAFLPADEIDAAYGDGRLRATDILLTDGVPADIPPVAGVISLRPSTPSSHVAILAQSFGVPFVYFVDPAERERTTQLAGREVALEVAVGGPGLGSAGCRARVIDLEGQLSPELRAEILALKTPPPLAVTPKQPFGAYWAPTDALVPADIQYFGGKAANFGFLRRSIPDHSPPSIALSFDLWDEFLDQTLPTGKTLRQEIHDRLSSYTFPPDLAALRADLATIRSLIRRTAQFTPAQAAAIQAALSQFDPQRNLRFRSSTNVEDAENFTGAGLYDSYSGCLADDLDDDTRGPSRCDPTETDERGVFRAIQRVYASFYNENAFLERRRHGVNEDHVGMAVLVHHSFPDTEELANGVATVTLTGASSTAQLVTQRGAVSVANPDGSAQPEIVEVNRYSFGTFASFRRQSSLVQLGAYVMDWEQDYLDLASLLFTAADAYRKHFPAKQSPVLDFEYKKLKPGRLEVKQIRELPQPDRAETLLPFLVNEPTAFCVFQGEHSDVLANHRLKCVLSLATQSLRLVDSALERSFYTDAALEYHQAGRIQTHAGPLTEWPNAAHRRSGLTLTERWSLGDGPAARTYELTTTLPKLRVSRAESPLFTMRDFALELKAVYATPVPTIDFTGNPTTTTEERVTLVPCPTAGQARILQTRTLPGPQNVRVDTRFYWPPPPLGAVAGYTAPLVRFEETRLVGFTSQPILLRGYYSQTYHPFHHNFVEEFVFEPRLEPGLPASTLAELAQADIQLIVVSWNFESAHFRVLGLDGRFRDWR